MFGRKKEMDRTIRLLNDFLLINEKKIAAITEFLGIFYETRPANNETLVAKDIKLRPVPFKADSSPGLYYKTEGVPCGTEPHKPFAWINGIEITKSDLAVLVKCGVPFKIEYSDTIAKKKGK